LLGLGLLQRADRAVEGGPGCAQFGQHVDRRGAGSVRSTNAPTPCRVSTSPSSTSSCWACLIVLSPGTW